MERAEEKGRLVLWDVDLTLIELGDAGREIYRAAFEQVTGRPMGRVAAMAGRTEPDIFQDALLLNHVPAVEHSFGRFAEALAAAYAARSALLRQRGRALPGAARALAALNALPGVVQSVLTGNVAPVAALKLATFGLDVHVDLEVGAYGSDDRVRANLVQVARGRVAAKYGTVFDQKSTVLVGDSPNDVLAAQLGGAAVVAVASGRSSAADLRAAGAEVVLVDLVDTAAVLEAVMGAGRR